MSEVIIDGVNVAECEFLLSNYECMSNYNCDCGEITHFDKCKDCPNCYFKQLQRAKAELEMSKHYAELLKANRCHHTVLGECSEEHHNNCVGKKQCILDLEQIISNLKAENEKLKAELDKYKRVD